MRLIDADEFLKKLDNSPLIKDAMRKAFDQMPTIEPETYEEKLKEIADALSEKFAYMNTCLNERDIILGYLGVKRPSKTHCNTDCTNIKCESHRCNKNLSSAEPDIEQAAKLLSDFIESCPGGDSYLITPNGEELRTDWGYAMEGIRLIHDWAERRTDE